MNIYDRIINILLEARIEDYLDRLDESIMPTKPKRTGGIILNPKKQISKKKMGYKTPSTIPSNKGKKPLDEASNDAQLDYVGVMPIKKRKPGSHEHGLANLMRKTAADHLTRYRKKNPIGSPDRMAKRAKRYNRPYGRPPEPDYD